MAINPKNLFKFSDLSIKRKLVSFTMIVSTVTMILALGAIVTLDRMLTKQNMVEEVDALSQVIAARSEVGINFGDKRNSQSNVDALKNSTEYVLGCIYGKNNQLLAKYPQNNAERNCPDKTPLALNDFQHITSKFIHQWTPVYRNGQEIIGYLYLQRSLNSLNTRLTRFVLSSLAILGIALIFGYGIITWLQGIISKPILDLSEVAKKIALNNNYQLRAKIASKDEIGTLGNAFNLMLDTTEKAQKKLEFMAFNDALTGLPNRRYFMETLDRNMASVQRGHRSIALFLIDLDGFKGVNDTIGHDAGDMVLTTVSERMPQILRQSDMVARLGGDEFTVILTDISSPEIIRKIAIQLIKKIEEPITFKGQRADVSASVGIAMAPYDTTNMDVLLKLADAAMYRAKGSGKRTFYFYNAEIDQQMKSLKQKEELLFNQLHKETTELLYQPVISTLDNSIKGLLVSLRILNIKNTDTINIDSSSTSTIRHIANTELSNLMLTTMLILLENDIKHLVQQVGSDPVMVFLPVTNEHLRNAEYTKTLLSTLKLMRINGLELKLAVDRSSFESQIDEELQSALILSDDGHGAENLGGISHDKSWCMASLPNHEMTEWDKLAWHHLIESGTEAETKIIAINLNTELQLNFCQSLEINLVSGNIISPNITAKEVSKLITEKLPLTFNRKQN